MFSTLIIALALTLIVVSSLLIITPTRIATTTPLSPTVPARLVAVLTSVVITLTSLLAEFGVVFVTLGRFSVYSPGHPRQRVVWFPKFLKVYSPRIISTFRAVLSTDIIIPDVEH